MRISQLIDAVGDENVGFQLIDECATDMNWTAKSGTRISFRSNVALTPDGTKRLGIVVWLDREAVKKARNAWSAAHDH